MKTRSLLLYRVAIVLLTATLLQLTFSYRFQARDDANRIAWLQDDIQRRESEIANLRETAKPMPRSGTGVLTPQVVYLELRDVGIRLSGKDREPGIKEGELVFTGTVRNPSSYRLTCVEVNVELFNASGTNVSSGMDNPTDDLGPGETCRFAIPVEDSELPLPIRAGRVIRAQGIPK